MLPESYKKLVVQKLSTNFREAVSVQTVPLKQPTGKEVLIKNKYVGINATDINITAGRYMSPENPPFGVGLEGIGEVVSIGDEVKNVDVGQIVVFFSLRPNAYAEYSYVHEEGIIAVPVMKPEYLVILLSGLTAAIGLDKNGRIMDGETVLVTAAAGGAGHLAVQWAKAAGCHVIATCSTDKKAEILKDLGCDRIINYKTESLDSILEKEYPKGVDVIWETIGGKVFETCLKHIAKRGRLLIVGGITGYQTDDVIPKINLSHVPQLLLFKSAALQGFLLSEYKECFSSYYNYLMERTVNNELQILIDNGLQSRGKEFVHLDGIIDAVEYLHSGNSTGKVIVRIA